MKKNILLLVWAICLPATMAQTQELHNTVGLGIRAGTTFYQGDDFATAGEWPYSDAFLVHHLSGHFAYELSVSYGQVAGNLLKKEAFWTDFAGVGVLGQIAPFGGKAIRPYIAGGAEYFSTNPRRFNRKKSFEKNNFSTPLGGGLGFILGENIALDLRGLYHFVSNDRLDDKRKGANDGFVSATVGLSWLFRGNPDADRDGLANRDEKTRGTNPKLADTDRDGIKDGAEVSTFRTNPLAIDSDSDGLSDLDEIKKYKSDPTQADTDQDGLTDDEEVSKYQTNLLKGDTDDDDLSDAEELQVHKTNPNLADSDDDGLKDGEEIARHQTQPLEIDSDGDGLLDGDEVKKYQTDPLKQDTDGGTIADATEVNRGTNPLDSNDDLPKREILKIENNALIVLDGVVFETGRAVLSPESESILRKALNTLQYYPDMKVAIHGHTDNAGGAKTNMRLSQARADAVKAYLVDRGIASERIVTKGFGPYQPIAPNDTPEGRRQNRRIEFSRSN